MSPEACCGVQGGAAAACVGQAVPGAPALCRSTHWGMDSSFSPAPRRSSQEEEEMVAGNFYLCQRCWSYILICVFRLWGRLSSSPPAPQRAFVFIMLQCYFH